MIDLYTLPNCGECAATKRIFTPKGLVEGVDWAEHDLSDPENEAARAWIMDDLNYSKAPIIVTDDDHWCGFRPDKLTTLTTKGQ